MARQSFTPDDYFKILDLTQDPFQNKYSKELFFTSDETQHRLDLIKHLLQVSQQVLLIKGREKVGKTLFAQHLVVTADDDWLACRIDATQKIDPDILVKSMLREHQNDTDDTSESIALINKHLAHCNLIGKIPILFIDNADKLNEKTLRFIFQLMSFKEKNTFIRIVLIGQDSLLQRINEIADESSNTGLVHTINIPTFDLKETTAYLRYLLAVCGGREDMFSDKEISRIHKVSGGLAGNISFLARQGLSDPANLDLKVLSPKTSNKNTKGARNKGLFVIACLLITFIIIYVWSYLQEDESINVEQISLRLPEKQFSVSSKHSDELNKGEPISLAQSSLEPEVFEEKVEVANKNELDSTVNIPDVLKLSHTESAGAAVPGLNQPGLPAVTEAKLEQQDSQRTTKKMEITSSEIRDHEWLQQQSRDHYVIQLIGAVEMTTIKRFLKGAQLDQEQLSLYQAMQADKPWHVLVYGLYSNREEARAAISTLSKDVQQGKPWAKSISSIHEAIKTE
jgi:DamX protein